MAEFVMLRCHTSHKRPRGAPRAVPSTSGHRSAVLVAALPGTPFLVRTYQAPEGCARVARPRGRGRTCGRGARNRVRF